MVVVQHRIVLPLLALVAAGSLILSACGSDDDSSSDGSDTTSAQDTSADPGDGSDDPGGGPDDPQTQEFCRVARRTQNPAKDQIPSVIDQQLEAAPPEVKADLSVLRANVEVLQAEAMTPEGFQIIKDPLINLIRFEGANCGIIIDLG